MTDVIIYWLLEVSRPIMVIGIPAALLYAFWKDVKARKKW